MVLIQQDLVVDYRLNILQSLCSSHSKNPLNNSGVLDEELEIGQDLRMHERTLYEVLPANIFLCVNIYLE